MKLKNSDQCFILLYCSTLVYFSQLNRNLQELGNSQISYKMVLLMSILYSMRHILGNMEQINPKLKYNRASTSLYAVACQCSPEGQEASWSCWRMREHGGILTVSPPCRARHTLFMQAAKWGFKWSNQREAIYQAALKSLALKHGTVCLELFSSTSSPSNQN